MLEEYFFFKISNNIIYKKNKKIFLETKNVINIYIYIIKKIIILFEIKIIYIKKQKFLFLFFYFT